jgi:hypothetical protein
MANRLNRDIADGEQVIIGKQYVRPEYYDLNERVFVVKGGFGRFNDTAGEALFGHFLSESPSVSVRMEGFMIDPAETQEWQTSAQEVSQ